MKYKILLKKVKSCAAVAFLFLILFAPCRLPGQTNETIVDGIKIKEVWITMKDRVSLAADLYSSVKTKETERLPVILEYLPYRKDESRAGRLGVYSYFVDHGYIITSVDIRGTGRSEGKLVDGEYSEQEQLDGEEIIDWLSKQDFSNGNIAMLGISWGGFNGLHMAMRRVPALKTIITMMSTDDIYEDDVHFMDGMMHVDAYELMMDVDNMIPAAPEFNIDGNYIKNRFDTEPWLLKYKRHQADGPFWNRASLNVDYSQIDIPVFLVAGWYDGYRDFVPRMIQNADVPFKALIGPWNHTFPHWANPEPAIEWREMAVRWLDHWCKGKDTGILNEPDIYYYQRDWHAPGLDLTNIPGDWYISDQWPETEDSLLYLTQDHGLAAEPSIFQHSLKYNPTVGVAGSGSVLWWGDWADDQKSIDAQSLVYESEIMTADVEILGFPQVILQTSVNAPTANWIVRLSDVAPNGQVTLITGAGFNGSHVESSQKPLQLEMNRIYDIKIDLHATSWTFEKGHKIRIAVNNAQWPMIWPSQYEMTSTIRSNDKVKSVFKLPILRNPVSMEKSFPKPVPGPKMDGYNSIASETNTGYAEIKEIIRNTRTKTTTVIATNSTSNQYPWGIQHTSDSLIYKLSDNDPAHASVQSIYKVSIEQDGRILKFTGILDLTSDEKTYFYRYKRTIHENGELKKEKDWKEDVPRLW